jgi:hypothetical protein
MVHDGLLAAAATLLHFIDQHVTSEPLVKERSVTQLAEIQQPLESGQYQSAQAQYQKYSLAEWIEFAKSNTP